MAITLGGGSASQINEVILLNNDANTVTLADGRVYLKGGVYETNPSTYPLASLSFQQSGINFSVASQDGACLGITWDGTHYWVVGTTTDTAYKYTAAGVYTGTSFSVGGELSSPYGIEWDGTHFWVVGSGGLSGNTVFKYNSAGVYQSVAWSTAAQAGTTSYSISWDGSHFWVLSSVSPTAYKYNSSGVYQSVSIDFSGEVTTAKSLAWDGTYFWMLGANGVNTDKAYKYTSAGVYAGTSFSTAAYDNNAFGLAWDGTYFALVGNQNDKVWQFSAVAGVASASSINGQNYVRVA